MWVLQMLRVFVRNQILKARAIPARRALRVYLREIGLPPTALWSSIGLAEPALFRIVVVFATDALLASFDRSPHRSLAGGLVLSHLQARGFPTDVFAEPPLSTHSLEAIERQGDYQRYFQ